MLDDWRRLMEMHRCHGGPGLKLYISNLSKPILRGVTDATMPCNIRRRIATAVCLALVMMHQQIREAARRAAWICCFLSSGARVAEL